MGTGMNEKLIECLDALIAADTNDGSLQLAQTTFLPAIREALKQRGPIHAQRITEIRAEVEERGISKPWLDLVKFARAIEAEHGIAP